MREGRARNGHFENVCRLVGGVRGQGSQNQKPKRPTFSEQVVRFSRRAWLFKKKKAQTLCLRIPGQNWPRPPRKIQSARPSWYLKEIQAKEAQIQVSCNCSAKNLRETPAPLKNPIFDILSFFGGLCPWDLKRGSGAPGVVCPPWAKTHAH